jgi:hypothetical protein
VELDLLTTPVPKPHHPGSDSDDHHDSGAAPTLGKKLQDLLSSLTGRRTVPNIMINAQSLGGSDDVAHLEQEGRLEKEILRMGGKRIVSVVRNSKGYDDWREIVVPWLESWWNGVDRHMAGDLASKYFGISGHQHGRSQWDWHECQSAQQMAVPSNSHHWVANEIDKTGTQQIERTVMSAKHRKTLWHMWWQLPNYRSRHATNGQILYESHHNGLAHSLRPTTFDEFDTALANQDLDEAGLWYGCNPHGIHHRGPDHPTARNVAQTRLTLRSTQQVILPGDRRWHGGGLLRPFLLSFQPLTGSWELMRLAWGKGFSRWEEEQHDMMSDTAIMQDQRIEVRLGMLIAMMYKLYRGYAQGLWLCWSGMRWNERTHAIIT